MCDVKCRQYTGLKKLRTQRSDICSMPRALLPLLHELCK